MSNPDAQPQFVHGFDFDGQMQKGVGPLHGQDGDSTDIPVPSSSPSDSIPVIDDGRSEFIPAEEIAALFPLSMPQLEGKFDPEIERLRKTVTGVREIKARSNKRIRRAFAQIYLEQLQQPSNRSHFTDIPERVRVMEDRLKQKNVHGLAVYNALDEVVGFAIVRDPETDQNDSWLEKMVVVENLQNNDKDDKEAAHVGTQALDKIAGWVFSTPTHDGRNRNNLHAAVVMFVNDYERMDHLLDKYGFEPRMRLQKQAIVTLRDGSREERDVQRWELSRRTWETMHGTQLSAGTPVTLAH